MKINLVTLCSGIEAQGQAMRKLCADYPELDWELLAWSEIDKDAIKAHNAIFPEYADRNLGDMTTCDYSNITEQVDVLFYSTPCQSVSVAGLNKGMKEGSDAASALIWHTRRAIETLKPKVCILENVKGMIMGKNLKEFHKWCDVMESYGYTNFAKILNSKDYGVPQNRERLFMISILNCTQSYHFPEPLKLEKRIKDILEPYGSVDESYYFKPEQLLRIISHCDRKVEEGCGFKAQFHTEDEISGCITARYGQRETDPAIKEGISIHPLNRKMEFQGFNSIQSDTAPCLTAHDGRGGEPCLWERTDKIIKLGNYTPKGTHAGTLVSSDGIAPTVMGQHGTVTGVVEPVMKQIGAIYGNNAQAGRIYDEDGISPCLDTCCGGNRMPKILTSVRTEEAKKLRRKGIEVFKHRELVPREDGISNTITTIVKDNLLQEPAIIQRPHGFNNGGLFQEVAPTITTSSWEANNLIREPIKQDRQSRIRSKVMPNGNIRFFQDDESKSGISEMQIIHPDNVCPTVITAHTPKVLEPIAVAMRGRNPDNPSDKTKGAPMEQRLEFGDNVANCITTVPKDSMVAEPQICSDPRKEFGRMDFSEISPTVVATDCKSPKIVREPMELSFENLPDKTVLKDEDGKGYLWQDGGLWRVRKLTPIECFRLQGVSDEDAKKIIAVCSKTACYCLAGNSITVDVLYHLFRKLWIDTDNESAQKSLFDF